MEIKVWAEHSSKHCIWFGSEQRRSYNKASTIDNNCNFLSSWLSTEKWMICRIHIWRCLRWELESWAESGRSCCRFVIVIIILITVWGGSAINIVEFTGIIFTNGTRVSHFDWNFRINLSFFVWCASPLQSPNSNFRFDRKTEFCKQRFRLLRHRLQIVHWLHRIWSKGFSKVQKYLAGLDSFQQYTISKSSSFQLSSQAA